MNFLSLIPEGSNIAVIGGGGKTGLIENLADEIHAAGRLALVTVTTRLARWQFPKLARVEAASLAEALEAVERARRGERLLLAGPGAPENITLDKLSGLPLEWFPELRQAAHPGLTLLVEADGSAGLPLKAHRPGEPVLPPLSNYVVGVIGLKTLIRPWPEAVHRPEVLGSYVELPPEDRPLSPEQVAAYIRAAWSSLAPNLIFLNQVDLLVTEPARHLGRRLADLLMGQGFSVVIGSLRHETFFRWES